MSHILKCFKTASGLKVKFQKSGLFGIRTSEAEIQNNAHILGCSNSYFPFKYLGVPFDANMLLKNNLETANREILSKLSNQNAHIVSFGGRMTLTKSILSSLPTYYLSLFKAPHGILECLKKKRLRFIQGGFGNKNKTHWVDWPTVVAHMKERGLGVRTLSAQNMALLLKWWWRLKTSQTLYGQKLLKASEI